MLTHSAAIPSTRGHQEVLLGLLVPPTQAAGADLHHQHLAGAHQEQDMRSVRVRGFAGEGCMVEAGGFVSGVP
jgi:hypothetical protein